MFTLLNILSLKLPVKTLLNISLTDRKENYAKAFLLFGPPRESISNMKIFTHQFFSEYSDKQKPKQEHLCKNYQAKYDNYTFKTIQQIKIETCK